MSVSRRSFVRTLGLGTTALSTSLLVGREAEAQAFAGSPAAAPAAAEEGAIRRLK